MVAKVYLAGPIGGLSYTKARYGWREDISNLIDPDLAKCVSPMRFKNGLVGEKNLSNLGYESSLHDSQRALTVRDFNDVKRCDVVVACLMKAKKISIGTMIELGWASALGKPIVLIMEKKKNKNVHDHAIVRELASWQVETLDDAAEVVHSLVGVCI